MSNQRRPKAKGSTKNSVQNRLKNKLERDFAEHLTLRIAAGEIHCWEYEPIKLRIGYAAYYTPDFMVVYNDGQIVFIETKGFMREAARVRLRTAAELFPWFEFHVTKRGKGGAWETYERFNCHE